MYSVCVRPCVYLCVLVCKLFSKFVQCVYKRGLKFNLLIVWFRFFTLKFEYGFSSLWQWTSYAEEIPEQTWPDSFHIFFYSSRLRQGIWDVKMHLHKAVLVDSSLFTMYACVLVVFGGWKFTKESLIKKGILMCLLSYAKIRRSSVEGHLSPSFYNTLLLW